MVKIYAFLIVVIMMRASGCRSSPIKPIPPRIPLALETVARDATNAGRVESIAVNPTNRNHAILAMEFGGLWKTHGGGSAWFRITSLPAVFVRDVEFSADGRTVVAAVFRDNQTVNGGGIYVSRDGGDSWSRPPTGVVPVTNRTPVRTSAHSVSRAPDERGLWYAGTDYGVAVSRDNGATWVHRSPEEFSLGSTGVATPIEGDRQQDASQSVLGMYNGRVLAMSRTLVVRSDDYGATWRKVITDNFRQGAPGGGLPGTGSNKMDRSPFDSWAFIYKEFTTSGSKLWFYELGSETKTLLPFPQGRWRGPFVRISKDKQFGGRHITIWVGAGWDGYFVTRETAESIRSIRSDSQHNDWVSFIGPAGIHADLGDMGVDGNFQPAYIGSDGGIFKPHSTIAGRWISAAAPGSGMNSFQIMDFAGTNMKEPRGIATHLYFATQDNKIWASPDGGNTWPNNDSQEGYGLEVRGDAVAGEPITVGYRAIGAHSQELRFSDALLVNSRPVPDIDRNGQALTGWGLPFFLSQQTATAAKPSFWARLRQSNTTPGTEVYVSPNSGASWTQTGILNFAPAGEIKRTANGLIGWVPVQTGGPNSRIGLVPLIPTLGLNDNTIHTYDDSDLVRLPNNGGLGMRGTMWDFHAVFGVHPVDWGFLIAPDIFANDVKVSRDGGQTWKTDVGLTKQVLRGGQLKLWDDSPFRMQVTTIAFDPYLHGSFVNRIFVGTRDAGIMCSADNGGTWRTIKSSDEIKYITAFHFHPSGGVYVSAYGHGLWYVNPSQGCPETYRFPWDVKPPVLDPTPGVAANVARKDEMPRPRGEANLNIPRLFLAGSIPASGIATLGEDSALSVSGIRFPPNAAVTLTIHGSNVLDQSVHTDEKGRFTTTIRIPDEMPYGLHTLVATMKREEKTPNTLVADFVKAYADSK
jgi:hypothetical protein